MLTKMLTDMMTKSGASPVFENPKDYDLDYENVTFKAQDGVELSGWLIKGGSDKVVIQSHFGVQCSRSGYTPKGKGMVKIWDKDISFLRQAKYFVRRGYSVLMYDLRNHGNSSKGSSEWIAWGCEEAKDVIAAVDFISKHPNYQHADIGLLSVCMGTSATAFAYGMEPGLSQYANIKALVSVQPLRYTNYMKAMGIPDFLTRRVNEFNLKRGGADLTDSFFKHVGKINVPTLVIQNKNDPWTDLDSVKEYYDLLPGEKEMLWLDLAKKRAAAYDWLGESPQQMANFFSKYLGKSPWKNQKVS